MKKIALFVMATALLITASSAFNPNPTTITPGEKAPILTLENTPLPYSGGYTLLTFWNPADGASRAQCHSYQSALKNTQAPVAMHSVCLDGDSALYDYIVASDNLSNSTLVSAHDSERIRKDFGLGDRYGAILVDASGTIVAVNPTPSELAALR